MQEDILQYWESEQRMISWKCRKEDLQFGKGNYTEDDSTLLGKVMPQRRILKMLGKGDAAKKTCLQHGEEGDAARRRRFRNVGKCWER
ncbi:hypothetical protein AVEN_20473-1 [Araneus ventricosus]|uniref:Uncharacterized protein n=1 Tax=Araneus ventricosus TaxID=182803 RepID=A0A4Y2IZ38_ARAVE|nr:hypothetical protein AVEN_20473-1 [Araneus ventricosus]